MGTRSRSVAFRRLVSVAGILLLPACGGSSRLEFYADEPGNFRALVAGKPGHSRQEVASAAGQLGMNSMESVDNDQIRRVVVYTDLPGPMVESSGPDALLDGGVRGMSGKEQWSVERQEPITLDGHPGREVRFAVNAPKAPEKGAGRARIFLVGSRLYQVIMVGPASKVDEEELDHFVKSFELLKKVAAVAVTAPLAPGAAVTGPALVARAGPPPAAPPTSAPGAPPISPPAPAVRPAPAAGPTVVAEAEDDPPPTSSRVRIARPAPAAGPTVVAEAEDDPPPPSRIVRTSPARATRSRPVRGRARTPAPAETQAVSAADQGPDPSKPATHPIKAKKTTGRVSERPLANGNRRDRFRELAPNHGVLVGVRVGYVDKFRGSKVGAVQPIFQVGDTYVEGTQYGMDIPPSVTIVARPGYAVGAIHTQTGLLLDSFQLVFMRFKNGRLDARNAYTTDWLGDPGGGRAGTATGGGKLVVGVHGRTNGREINALGLLVAE